MPEPRRRRLLAVDTSPEAEDVQLARWRAMSGADKLQSMAALCAAADQMARAGIAHRYPESSERERFLRLAILKLGATLAIRAYPDAAAYVE